MIFTSVKWIHELTLVGRPTSTPRLAVSLMFARHAFHLTRGIRRRCAIKSFLFLTVRVPGFTHLRFLLGGIFHWLGSPVDIK